MYRVMSALEQCAMQDENFDLRIEVDQLKAELAEMEKEAANNLRSWNEAENKLAALRSGSEPQGAKNERSSNRV